MRGFTIEDALLVGRLAEDRNLSIGKRDLRLVDVEDQAGAGALGGIDGDREGSGDRVDDGQDRAGFDRETGGGNDAVGRAVAGDRDGLRRDVADGGAVENHVESGGLDVQLGVLFVDDDDLRAGLGACDGFRDGCERVFAVEERIAVDDVGSIGLEAGVDIDHIGRVDDDGGLGRFVRVVAGLRAGERDLPAARQAVVGTDDFVVADQVADVDGDRLRLAVAVELVAADRDGGGSVDRDVAGEAAQAAQESDSGIGRDGDVAGDGSIAGHEHRGGREVRHAFEFAGVDRAGVRHVDAAQGEAVRIAAAAVDDAGVREEAADGDGAGADRVAVVEDAADRDGFGHDETGVDERRINVDDALGADDAGVRDAGSFDVFAGTDGETVGDNRFAFDAAGNVKGTAGNVDHIETFEAADFGIAGDVEGGDAADGIGLAVKLAGDFRAVGDAVEGVGRGGANALRAAQIEIDIAGDRVVVAADLEGADAAAADLGVHVADRRGSVAAEDQVRDLGSLRGLEIESRDFAAVLEAGKVVLDGSAADVGGLAFGVDRADGSAAAEGDFELAVVCRGIVDGADRTGVDGQDAFDRIGRGQINLFHGEVAEGSLGVADIRAAEIERLGFDLVGGNEHGIQIAETERADAGETVDDDRGAGVLDTDFADHEVVTLHVDRFFAALDDYAVALGDDVGVDGGAVIRRDERENIFICGYGSLRARDSLISLIGIFADRNGLAVRVGAVHEDGFALVKDQLVAHEGVLSGHEAVFDLLAVQRDFRDIGDLEAFETADERVAHGGVFAGEGQRGDTGDLADGDFRAFRQIDERGARNAGGLDFRGGVDRDRFEAVDGAGFGRIRGAAENQVELFDFRQVGGVAVAADRCRGRSGDGENVGTGPVGRVVEPADIDVAADDGAGDDDVVLGAHGAIVVAAVGLETADRTGAHGHVGDGAAHDGEFIRVIAVGELTAVNVEVAVVDSRVRNRELDVAVDRAVLLVRGAAAEVQGSDRGTADLDVDIADDDDVAAEGSRSERVADQGILDDDVDAVFKVVRTGGLRKTVEVIAGSALEIEAVGAVAVEAVAVDVVVRQVHGASGSGINGLAGSEDDPFFDVAAFRDTRRDCVCTVLEVFKSLPED